MTRIRKLAVLTVTAMAISATAASLASASSIKGFSAQQYPVTLNGAPESSDLYSVIGGVAMTCYNQGFTAALSEPAETVTTSSLANPLACYGGAKAGSIDWNGCQLELDPSGAGSVGIGPAECGPVDLDQADCGAVNLTIPPQDRIAAEYETVGSGAEATVKVYIEDYIEYVATGYPGCANTEGPHDNLYLKASYEISGADSEENAVGVSAVTGGLYMSGGDGEGEPRLEAAEYSAEIDGEQAEYEWSKTQLLSNDDYEIACESAQVDGGTLSGPASDGYTLAMDFSECAAILAGEGGKMGMHVDMSSCVYEYSNFGFKSEGLYESEARISCDEGDGIEIIDESQGMFCSFEIPGQVLNAPTTTLNSAFEGVSGILGVTEGSSVKYTQTGQFCMFLGRPNGSYEDGDTKLDTLLFGSFSG